MPKPLLTILLASLSLFSFPAFAQWSPVGNAHFSTLNSTVNSHPKLKIAPNDVPFVIYTDSITKKTLVYRFNGSAWPVLGSAAVSAGVSHYSDMAFTAGSTPYVVYQNLDTFAVVRKFDGANWVDVGDPIASSTGKANNSCIAVAPDSSIYVFLTDLQTPNTATVLINTGPGWAALGSNICTSIASSLSIAVDAGGTPYIAYKDKSQRGRITVKKWNGTTWVAVGMKGFSEAAINYTSITMGPDGNPYVAYRDSSRGTAFTVKHYDGNNWINVGSPGLNYGSANDDAGIVVNSRGMVYHGFSTSSGIAAYVFNHTSWYYNDASYVNYTPDCASLAINSQGKLYLAYVDSAKISVRTYLQDIPDSRFTKSVVALKQAKNVVLNIMPADSMHIWGLAGPNAAVDSLNDLEVVTSANSGVTWQSTKINGTKWADSIQPSNLFPIDGNTAYLSLFNNIIGGGKLLKTTDGGSSWQPVSIGTNAFVGGFLDFVYFPSPDTGLVVGDPNGGYFEIYRTTNAGQTWTKVPSANIPAPLSQENGYSGLFSFSGDSVFFSTNKFRIYYSGDKGITWNVRTIPFTGNELYFKPANGAEIVYSNNNALNQYEIYHVNSGTIDTLTLPNVTSYSYIYSFYNTRKDHYMFALRNATLWGTDNIDSVSRWNPQTNFIIGPPIGLLNNVSTFYSKNLGWIIGGYSPATQFNNQVIWRYENCQPTSLASVNGMPAYLCQGHPVINLADVVSPAGGFALVDGAVVTSLDPGTRIANIPDINYIYTDNNGCVENGDFVMHYSLYQSPVTVLITNIDTICHTGAAFNVIPAPPGGIFNSAAIDNDQFVPSLANIGLNHIVYYFTDSNQCTGSASVDILVDDCTGISEVAGIQFNSYPNPVTGNLILESESLQNQDIKVSVCDVAGKEVLVHQYSNSGTRLSIDLSRLNAGPYVVTVQLKNDRIVARIIKQ